MEKLLEDISFTAEDRHGETLVIGGLLQTLRQEQVADET